MVYKSIPDTIGAWSYPDGSLLLAFTTVDQMNATTKGITLAQIITQLFGESVDSWINDHLAASRNADQKRNVDDLDITIQFSGGGIELTSILITPKGTSK